MKKYVPVSITILLSLLFNPVFVISSFSQDITVTSVQKTKWKYNAKGVYSIIHDDFGDGGTTGLHEYAIPEANKRGIKLGLGALVSECVNNNYWAIIRDAVGNGHEIINHSYTHINLSTASSSVLQYEIVDATEKLHKEIRVDYPDYKVTFFIFPYDEFSSSAIAVLKENGYIGARCGSKQQLAYPSANFDSYMGVNFDVYDQWGGTQKYGINDFPDAAISNGAWAVREFHGVGDESWHPVPVEEYKEHLDHIKAKMDAHELWVGTPSTVIKYCKTYHTCGEPSYSGNIINFPSGSSVDDKYATDISLIVGVTESPEMLVARQEGKKCEVIEWGTDKYLINAHPKKGDVILTAENPNGPFALTVTAEGGTVLKDPDQDKYLKGTKVKLTAVPKNDNFVFTKWSGGVSSSENPLTITITDEMEIHAKFKEMTQLIVNGTFDGGTDGWGLYVDEDAGATANVENGEYVLTVTQKGTESWHIQMSQGGIYLLKGRSYTLTFSARSSTGSGLLQIGLYDATGGTHYASGQYPLIDAMQEFKKEFIMMQPDDLNASLFIDMGLADYNLIIDNVSLKVNPITGVSAGYNNFHSINSIYTVLKNSTLYMSVPATGQWHIDLLDISGRTISSLEETTYIKGRHDISSITNMSGNGVYILRFSNASETVYTRCTWIK